MKMNEITEQELLDDGWKPREAKAIIDHLRDKPKISLADIKNVFRRFYCESDLQYVGNYDYVAGDSVVVKFSDGSGLIARYIY